VTLNIPSLPAPPLTSLISYLRETADWLETQNVDVTEFDVKTWQSIGSVRIGFNVIERKAALR
jgi:hypothetical protein